LLGLVREKNVELDSIGRFIAARVEEELLLRRCYIREGKDKHNRIRGKNKREKTETQFSERSIQRKRIIRCMPPANTGEP